MTNKICEICGGKFRGRYKGKGKLLCGKHLEQIRRCGKILDRTPFDKNKIIDKSNYYEMVLYNVKNEEIARTIFSKNQLKKVKQYKWYLNSNQYPTNKTGKKTIFLHQLILGKKEGYITDHKDENPLNNLNENLRFATKSQNGINRNNTKGITWHKQAKKWVAQIKVNYKHIHLGLFTNKSDALKARREGELKYYGEFAPIQSNLDKYL